MAKKNPDTEPSTTTEPEGAAEPGDTLLEIQRNTMIRQLQALVIDEMKAMPDVWQKMNQYRQDDVIGRVGEQITQAVGRVVEILASEDKERIKGTLEQIVVKDGIKAVVTLPRHSEHRTALMDCVGRTVVVVMADIDDFGQGEPPKADPDQPPLAGVDPETGEVIDKPVADSADGIPNE